VKEGKRRHSRLNKNSHFHIYFFKSIQLHVYLYMSAVYLVVVVVAVGWYRSEKKGKKLNGFFLSDFKGSKQKTRNIVHLPSTSPRCATLSTMFHNNYYCTIAHTCSHVTWFTSFFFNKHNLILARFPKMRLREKLPNSDTNFSPPDSFMKQFSCLRKSVYRREIILVWIFFYETENKNISLISKYG
jgi:hypothetical protein